jgi:hypothetical protein
MKSEAEIRAFRDDMVLIVQKCDFAARDGRPCPACYLKQQLVDVLNWVLQGDSEIDRTIERMAALARRK